MELGRESVAIPKHGHGPPETRIGQRIVRLVHDQERIAQRRQAVERRATVQRRRFDLVGIVDVEHARQDVDLATPRAVERAHRVGVDVEHDLVDARRRAPVFGEALEADALAALPAGEAKRPGADRLTRERQRFRPRAADDVLGQDRDLAQRAQHQIRRALQCEAHDAFGDELDRRDVGEQRAQRGGVGALAQQRLDGRLHVHHAERPLVVPAHAAADAHRHPHAIVGDVPALGQRGLIAAVAAIDQRLVHQPRRHLHRRSFDVAERHQIRRLAVQVHAQRPAASRRRRNVARRGQRPRGGRHRPRRREVVARCVARGGRRGFLAAAAPPSSRKRDHEHSQADHFGPRQSRLPHEKPPCYSGLAASRGGRGSP